MNFFGAIKTSLRNYADFDGRSSRSEYWWFFLFVVLVAEILFVTDHVIFRDRLFLSFIFNVVMFVPTAAVSIRRLHDRNVSGWWYVPAIAVDVWYVLALGEITIKPENRITEDVDILQVISLISIAVFIPYIMPFSYPGNKGVNDYGPPTYMREENLEKISAHSSTSEAPVSIEEINSLQALFQLMEKGGLSKDEYESQKKAIIHKQQSNATVDQLALNKITNTIDSEKQGRLNSVMLPTILVVIICYSLLMLAYK